MAIFVTGLTLLLGGAGLAAAGILKWGVVAISAVVIAVALVISFYMLK